MNLCDSMIIYFHFIEFIMRGFWAFYPFSLLLSGVLDSHWELITSRYSLCLRQMPTRHRDLRCPHWVHSLHHSLSLQHQLRFNRVLLASIWLQEGFLLFFQSRLVDGNLFSGHFDAHLGRRFRFDWTSLRLWSHSTVSELSLIHCWFEHWYSFGLIDRAFLAVAIVAVSGRLGIAIVNRVHAIARSFG